jgi:hypothetical protein
MFIIGTYGFPGKERMHRYVSFLLCSPLNTLATVATLQGVGHARLSPTEAVAVVAGSAEPRLAATVLQRVSATLLRYFSRSRSMAFAIAS